MARGGVVWLECGGICVAVRGVAWTVLPGFDLDPQ